MAQPHPSHLPEHPPVNGVTLTRTGRWPFSAGVGPVRTQIERSGPPIQLRPTLCPQELADALTEAGRQFAESLAGVVSAAQKAGLVPEQPPTEPKARALWLRQHRNTGPQRRNHDRRGRR